MGRVHYEKVYGEGALWVGYIMGRHFMERVHYGKAPYGEGCIYDKAPYVEVWISEEALHGKGALC